MSLPNTTEEDQPEAGPGSGPHKLPIVLATVGALVLGTALGWGARNPEDTAAYRELSEEHTATGAELAEAQEAEAARQETIDDLRDEIAPVEELDEREEGLDGREEGLDQWEEELTDLEEELDERETEVTTLETEVEENSIPGTGTFLVNEEVSPGTYRSDDLSSCYWARLSATDGSLDAIIANNFGGGRQIVTINGSDIAFETDSCDGWTRM